MLRPSRRRSKSRSTSPLLRRPDYGSPMSERGADEFLGPVRARSTPAQTGALRATAPPMLAHFVPALTSQKLEIIVPPAATIRAGLSPALRTALRRAHAGWRRGAGRRRLGNAAPCFQLSDNSQEDCTRRTSLPSKIAKPYSFGRVFATAVTPFHDARRAPGGRRLGGRVDDRCAVRPRAAALITAKLEWQRSSPLGRSDRRNTGGRPGASAMLVARQMRNEDT